MGYSLPNTLLFENKFHGYSSDFSPTEKSDSRGDLKQVLGIVDSGSLVKL